MLEQKKSMKSIRKRTVDNDSDDSIEVRPSLQSIKMEQEKRKR